MIIKNQSLNKEINLKELIKKYEITLSIEDIISIYNNEKRYYHNFDHVIDLLKNMKVYDETLVIAILFHDIVYDIKNDDNEKKSCEFFHKHCKYEHKFFIGKVKHIIMSTNKDVKPENDLEKEMIRLDRDILYSYDFEKLLKWEEGIFKEYQCYDISTYKSKRIDFLQWALDETGNSHLKSLIKIVKNKKYKIGFYPGSFNPFHKGHYNILKKAEKVFDKVIIGFGVNYDKAGHDKYTVPETIQNREIIEYSGLITSAISDLMQYGEVFLVRGLRNEYDLHYEENLRNAIKDLLEEQYFMYFFCDKEFEHISSSLIRDITSRDDKMAETFVEKYCLK